MARNRISTGIVIAGIILVALLLLVVFRPPPERYDIRIVAPPSIIASLPHWIAQEEGFYHDHLLRVEPIDVQSSPLMVEALLNGDADILPAVSLPDVINRSKAFPRPPRIYSHSRMRRDPAFESLLASNNGPVANLADLGGAQRIAVYPGVTSQALVEAFLKDNGVDTSAIEFAPLPPPEHLPALDRGDVVAVHLYEPFRTQALMSGRYRELSGGLYPWLAEPSAIGVSVVAPKFLDSDPDAAKAFFQVWDDAIRFIRENPQQARAILAKRLGLADSIAQSATWVDATTTQETNRDTILRTALRLQDIGLIPNDAALLQRIVTAP